MTLPPTNTELIAIMCHEVNRRWCDENGDSSQPCWADAPEWQQSSAIAGVDFHIANPDASPAASHESWLEQKIADGWKYGIEKDPEAKTHPCIVPFEDLPPVQQRKDMLFKAIVEALR